MEAGDLLRHTADACDHLGLSYLVTGSTASIAYGEPRFTNDIDIVIDLPAEKVSEFCEAFPPEEFYLSGPAVRDAVRRRSQFNLIHPMSGLKIDFIILSQSEFDMARASRRRTLPLLTDRTVCVASPEDVIIKKMLYFKEGQSPKHLRDIGGVLRIQGERIDREYIATWADKLGVADIWQAILEHESGEGSN